MLGHLLFRPLAPFAERHPEFRGARSRPRGPISDAANSAVVPADDTLEATGLSYPPRLLPDRTGTLRERLGDRGEETRHVQHLPLRKVSFSVPKESTGIPEKTALAMRRTGTTENSTPQISFVIFNPMLL